MVATVVMCKCGNHPANLDTGYCAVCEKMFAEYSQRLCAPHRAFFRGYRMSKAEIAKRHSEGWVCDSFTMNEAGGFSVSDWHMDLNKDGSAA